jgi:hypothetical protein
MLFGMLRHIYELFAKKTCKGVAICYNIPMFNKERKNVMMKKMNFGEVAGWVGLGCLQFNSVPAIISSVETGSTTPLGTIYLTLIGLFLYLVRSLKANDTLYTVGNTIGIIGNAILLTTIYWG